MNCMHRRRCNKRAGVSAALCVPKRQRKNIIWRFLWHRALRAAIDPIPILYMELLTKGHVREWLRTGEAMAKVNIDSLFPWCGCLCRIHRSVVQPERRLNVLMDERTLSELLNTQKISLARDVSGLQVLCTGEEGRGCLWFPGLKLLVPNQLLGVSISCAYFIMLLFTVGRRGGLEAAQSAGCSHRETSLSPGLAAEQSWWELSKCVSCPEQIFQSA